MEDPRLPVLLVPGWSDSKRTLRHLARYLADQGWERDAILPISFESRFGGNREHAGEIAAAASALLQRTGAPRLDIVAHSMGGLATRWFLHRLGGGALVRRAILLATPHRGTWAAYLAWGAGGADMRFGSPLLAELGACENEPLPVEFFTIRTPLDLRIFPGSSALLPAARNLSVRCPTHQRLVRNRRVLELVGELLGGP